MNAGIVHRDGKVVETGGGFPFDGGWAIPPLASRQQPSGEQRVNFACNVRVEGRAYECSGESTQYLDYLPVPI